MKSFRNRILLTATAVAAVCATVVYLHADIVPWMQSAISGSTIEAALYRAMDLPGIRTLYPRPPAEARVQLSALVTAKPGDAQLYALRAHVEEEALDFSSAEQDWKSFVAHAQDKTAAQFALADFYHRRNEGPQEIAALEAAASAPAPATVRFMAADRQSAWQAFPRALTIAQDQALGEDATLAIYKAWTARYPTEPAVRAKFIAALLKMRRFDDVQHAIDDYKTAFPQDPVFPIKAGALLAFDQGTPGATAQALNQFDKSYQPLWPSDLVSTYFALLNATHTQRAMLRAARAELLQNPDDLAAATKVFLYYQQQGRSAAATNVLTEYGASKEARHASWSADELYTFAALLDRDAQYPEAARYYFALASTSGRAAATSQSAEEAGLAGLTHILLTAPDQSIALGSSNLSIYRDLATLDQGPGYLNGILSLWLNSQDSASEFHDEEQKTVAYFHREKAAELLTILDQRFPASPERPALQAALIQAYVHYGQDAAIKQAGQRFLADFPKAPQRLEVALDVADADARTNDTQSEFALYDSLLTELARPLEGIPLSAGGHGREDLVPPPSTPDEPSNVSAPGPRPPASGLLEQSLMMSVTPPSTTAIAAAYREVLDRYLGRLVITNQPLAALALLRRELDRNPDDPLLYQRLADFLQQNNLSAQEEEVYQRALSRFNDTTFYDKLARFYLRQRRRQDFSALTRKVVDIFQGTDLERYFANVNNLWPEEYLQLNLYAHQRFPHELIFIRNLLTAYQNRATANPAARERLLREHWQEAPDLQTQFFNDLSRTHQLSRELAALEALVPSPTQQEQNPAATHELAEIHLWQSHFEQSAPLLGKLAQAYPGDVAIGEDAASVFRSLAYFDPLQIARAVAIREHLSEADPTNLDRLAIIGDTYADSAATSLNLDSARQLTQAAPFWRRMAAVHPGIADGYLQSATVFWDYFQFNDALTQIQAARKHFNNPTLFGYQAGAIYENQREVGCGLRSCSCHRAQSTLRHTRRWRAGSLALVARPQFTSLIDQASAAAVAQHPIRAALQLRVDLLNALHQTANIGPTVEAAIVGASTIDALSDLVAFSQNHQLPHAYRSALLREISLTTDPVEHIRLQYQLARSYEDEGDIVAAERIIEAVYNANSNARLAGVVRTTADFYWNNKLPQRAIRTLEEAAQKANPDLAHDFALEAIAKSNQSGDFAGARALLKPLLAADPFNAQYLNLEAESFSLAHDDAGLRDLYNSIIEALTKAPLNPIERRDKIALARQGMIPALTDLKDYGGAMDQHIALISDFPEDSNILQSAASYARLHGSEAQLAAFLNKTVADSPRDSRFAIDLARIDVQFEDYAGALAAYSKAIAIRSDRPDLYIARADLEEHQQSFDAACADYDRLYLLTYKDPQWMEKAALARVRQGRPDLAVKALQTAWIEGRARTAADYFRVAKQLEEWNLLSDADNFAAQGVKLAGNTLLADTANSQGAAVYARLLARERKAPEALALLTQILQASSISPSSPSIILQQVEKQGLASVTDSEWRAHLAQTRRERAEATFRNALVQIFSVVGEFYNRHDAALVEWREALTKLRAMVDLHSVPESFWTNFAAATNDANAYQIGRQLKPSMDAVLQAYIRKNGNYRSTELLHSSYIALEKQDTAGAAAWVLSLTSEVPANEQLAALEDLNYQGWIPRSQYDGIYRREIALAEAQLKNSSATQGNRSAENYFASQLTTIQTQYINWLLENDRVVEAERIFESIGAPQRKTEELRTVAVVLAATQSRLPALLAAYTSDSSRAPSLTALSSIANTLRLQRDLANSRLLLEYVFQQKLQQQSLTAPDYLALAEARISTHDLTIGRGGVHLALTPEQYAKLRGKRVECVNGG